MQKKSSIFPRDILVKIFIKVVWLFLIRNGCLDFKNAGPVFFYKWPHEGEERGGRYGYSNWASTYSERDHTRLLSSRWSGGAFLKALASVLSVEFVSIVIVDKMFPPSLSEVTCLHPILIKLFPCLVRWYPYKNQDKPFDDIAEGHWW